MANTHPSTEQIQRRQAMSHAKDIDHTHYYPLKPVEVAVKTNGEGYAAGDTNTAIPDDPTAFMSAEGHYYVDIDVTVGGAETLGTTTGSFSVWFWNTERARPVLLGIQAFDTAVNGTYRVEVGGRDFFVRADSVAAISEADVFVRFYAVLI